MASIEERGGGWKISWRMGGRGSRKQAATFHDPDDAERAKKLVEAHNGIITREAIYSAILNLAPEPEPVSTKPTLRDWVIEGWLPSRTVPSPSTLAYYTSQMVNRILPHELTTADHKGVKLGDLHLDQIRGRHIADLIKSLRAEGLKEDTVTRYYAVLHAAFRSATTTRDDDGNRLLDFNPCHESDFKRDQVGHDDDGSDDNPPVYLTPAQYRHLREQFAPHYRDLLDVLVGTGMRWSEATAVETLDLHPPRAGEPCAHVVRAWKKDGKGGRYIGPTKGKQRRDVPLPTWLIPRAEAMVATARDHKPLMVTHRGQPARYSFLLLTPTGKPYDYANFLTQVWNSAVVRAMRCPQHPPAPRGAPVPAGVNPGTLCKDHGGTTNKGEPCGKKLVPGTTRCRWHSGPAPAAVSTCGCPGILPVRPTPHDLRHTYASWYLAGGGNMRRLQRLLGHKAVSTTEIYAGLQPGTEHEVVDALDAAWERQDVSASAVRRAESALRGGAAARLRRAPSASGRRLIRRGT